MEYKHSSKPLKLCYLGNPILAAKAKPIENITEDIQKLSKDMLDVMYSHNGIGLAGNQVGIPLQIVVMDVEQSHDEKGNPIPFESDGETFLIPKMPVTFINPQIVATSDDASDYEEGCLSVPELNANVKRPSRVTLKTKLLDGSEFEGECAGLLARCLQHEIDHLNGTVYVQRADEADYKKIEKQLQKMVRKNGPRGFVVRRLV